MIIEDKMIISPRLAYQLKYGKREINWEGPVYKQWKSAAYFEQVEDLEINGVKARQAKIEDKLTGALVFNGVSRVSIRNCEALPGCGIFLKFIGPKFPQVFLSGNNCGLAWKEIYLKKTKAAKNKNRE